QAAIVELRGSRSDSADQSDVHGTTSAASLPNPALLSDVDDGDHRTAALGTLMHRVDGNEHGRIPDGRRRHPADRRLGMTMVMHVGIVQHDLPPPAQGALAVCLALDEAVDQLAAKVFRPRTLGQLEPGVADTVIDAVGVERILHDAMADA